MNCLVCLHPEVRIFYKDKSRNYAICNFCELIFVPRDQLLSKEDEHKRYKLHENSAEDESYQKYLNTVADGVISHLNKGSVGLDFGCGASHLLADILNARKMKVSSYDVFFHPREEVFAQKFDFIILCEVIEHLRNPLQELARLSSMLTSDGKIFIKTKFFESHLDEFSHWFYKNDPTHVQYFNEKSLSILGDSVGLHHYSKLSSKDLYLIQ